LWHQIIDGHIVSVRHAAHDERTLLMRAYTLDSFERPPGLREDLPSPQVGHGQLLVRVQASSVNPVDAGIAAGHLKDMFPHEFPVLVGRDYAGVVEQVGAGVTDYAAADAVFGFVPGMSPEVHDGSWAELIVVSQDQVAHLPEGVDLAQAGAAPLAGVTALAVHDALGLGRGDTVLMVGANGGVGTIAVQLAAAAGATVVAPGLAEDHDYLRGLGLAEVLDRTGDIAAQVRERHPEGVDAVADFASRSPDQLNTYAAVAREGGRIASSAGAAGEGPGRTNVMAVPAAATLERLAGLLADGSLRVPIQASFPLAQVDQALKTLGGQHTQGKVAITLP
jgi:NADPH:quinone reductase-like Zn-dependent oxidoreductase